MLNVLIYSKITTFSVIVPLLWGLLHYKSIKASRLILALLIISLLTECSSYLTLLFLNFSAYKIGLIYTVFEVLLLSYFYLESSAFKHKITVAATSILISVYLLLIYLFNFGGIDIPYAIVSIYEIIIVSIYMLNNINNIFSNWRFTIFFAYFQYNILAIGVFSMVDFIEKHQEYLVYYRILHSTANLFLYILITIGLYQCKKHFLKVSSL